MTHIFYYIIFVIKSYFTSEEAVDEFVEALHDSEASPDTVRSRGAKLKDFSIQLPRNVNIVICKKNAEEFVQQGKLDELFAFMDPTKSTDDTGIMTVLPDTENEDDRKEMIRDFQVGCVTHLVNNLLLKEFAGDAASKELLGGQSYNAIMRVGFDDIIIKSHHITSYLLNINMI